MINLMAFNSFFKQFKSHEMLKDIYVSFCLGIQLYAGLTLSEKYTVKFVGVTGPSMVPTLDTSDNLIMLDCFTTKFIRNPKKGEIVMCQNQHKLGNTIIKRVLYTEGETAEFFSVS